VLPVLLLTVCACVGYLYCSCVRGEENGSAYEASCCRVQRLFVEDAVVPRFSYGRGMLQKDGAPNRIFLTYLFGHQELEIKFLKDMDLIWSKVQCNIYERDMTWPADPDHPEGFRW